ncbi:MAG: M28 family peptidase [Myxococcales bacterium]|nr:M28 family peptidase [Myxococcales bacterium]
MRASVWFLGMSAFAALTAALWLGCGDDPAGPGGGGGAGTGTSTGSGASGGSGTTPTCGTDSPAALGACVETSRYVADLTALEGPRSSGDPLHQAARDLCASRFTEHGFQVEMHDYGSGVNVIGVRPGASDQRILVSAHYDGVPGCAAADDNASGVAGLLETARILGSAPAFDKTLVVACWDEEELGLVGSRAYAQRASQIGEAIAGHYVFEMIGYFDDSPGAQSLPFGFELVFPEEAKIVTDNQSRGDFLAIIGDDSFATGIERLDHYCDVFGLSGLGLTLSADQKNDPLYGDLQRSDHAPFWEQGFPALHMTDTSEFRYGAYHCGDGEDVKENLDHGFATKVIQATVAATAELLGPS